MDNISSDRRYAGTVVFTGSLHLPDGCIDQTQVAGDALFDAENIEHRFPVAGCEQAPGTDVVAQQQIVHIAGKAGTLEALHAVVDSAPTGNKKVIVDYQRSTAGGAWASVLTAPIQITSASSARVPVAGTIATSAYLASDLFKIVVTVSGDTGNQAQGLCVRAVHHEKPV